MFGKRMVTDLITRSAENERDRRNFLKSAAVAGIGVVGGAALASGTAGAATPAETATEEATDAAVLNFALNLEYLEAEFYSYAAYGHGVPSNQISGKGKEGSTTGGRLVNFSSPLIKAYANEIAGDEVNHVKFLRKALGSAAVARPAINIRDSFNGLAKAAGLGDSFDPYASDVNFLIGAFVFEDVGVTAYKGAAPLITNKTYLEAAAGILAVEAYHAGIIRTTLLAIDDEQPSLGIKKTIGAISALRDAVDGPGHADQGIGVGSGTNLVPTDGNSIAFSRSAANVLNIVYATNKKVGKGGFYPNGTNGAIHESDSN